MFLQALLQSAGCAAGTAAALSTKTQAWGWRSPSLMNQVTSKFDSVFFFTKEEESENKISPIFQRFSVKLKNIVKRELVLDWKIMYLYSYFVTYLTDIHDILNVTQTRLPFFLSLFLPQLWDGARW